MRSVPQSPQMLLTIGNEYYRCALLLCARLANIKRRTDGPYGRNTINCQFSREHHRSLLSKQIGHGRVVMRARSGRWRLRATDGMITMRSSTRVDQPVYRQRHQAPHPPGSPCARTSAYACSYDATAAIPTTAPAVVHLMIRSAAVIGHHRQA